MNSQLMDALCISPEDLNTICKVRSPLDKICKIQRKIGEKRRQYTSTPLFGGTGSVGHKFSSNIEQEDLYEKPLDRDQRLPGVSDSSLLLSEDRQSSPDRIHVVPNNSSMEKMPHIRELELHISIIL